MQRPTCQTENAHPGRCEPTPQVGPVEPVSNLQSADGVAQILTRWRDLGGVWKVNDLALLDAADAEGKAVDLNAPPA